MTQASIVQRLDASIQAMRVHGARFCKVEELETAKSEILRLEARVKELEEGISRAIIMIEPGEMARPDDDIIELLRTILQSSSHSLETE